MSSTNDLRDALAVDLVDAILKPPITRADALERARDYVRRHPELVGEAPCTRCGDVFASQRWLDEHALRAHPGWTPTRSR